MHEDQDTHDDFDDEEPTAEELAQIRNATPQEAAAVDELVLAQCSDQWCKVAMVIGSSLDEFEARFPNLPYVYMQLRIAELVEQGRLEARGDVRVMRHSEIRLASERGG